MKLATCKRAFTKDVVQIPKFKFSRPPTLLTFHRPPLP